MPRQILKPRPLDFDPDASVVIRPSFEPKLLFSLLAFKLCWKSTHRSALTGVRRRLNTPIGVSILSQPVEGILQAFDGIDVAAIKSPNRVVLDRMFFRSVALLEFGQLRGVASRGCSLRRGTGHRTPTGDPIISDRLQTDDPRFHRHRFEPIRR